MLSYDLKSSFAHFMVAKKAKVNGWIVNILEKLMLLNREIFCFSFAKTRVHYQKPALGDRLNVADYVYEKMDDD